jgi:hypothetical protein
MKVKVSLCLIQHRARERMGSGGLVTYTINLGYTMWILNISQPYKPPGPVKGVALLSSLYLNERTRGYVRWSPRGRLAPLF